MNATRCINQRFTFKNSSILCLALIFNLNNQRTTVMYTKKMVAGGEKQLVIYYYSFFCSTDTNLLLSA